MTDWTQERHDAAKASCEAYKDYSLSLSRREESARIAYYTDLPAALARIEEQDEAIDYMRNHWTPVSARACPLCEYKDGVFIKACRLHARILELETRGVSLEKFDKVAEANVTYEAELNDLRVAFGETKSRLDAALNRNTALEARVAELEAHLVARETIAATLCQRVAELEISLADAEYMRGIAEAGMGAAADPREVAAWKKLETARRLSRRLATMAEYGRMVQLEDEAVAELDEIRRQK